jgi:tetratricopeptide (TPR) repeat protein
LFAFELAETDGSRSLLIELKQRSAHLIADSGFMDYAKVWLKEAVDFYTCRGEAEPQGKAMVDLGRQEFYSGRIEPATDLFADALQLLPAGSFRYRVAALEALSNCYQKFGRLPEAVETLDRAFAEYADRRDSYRGYLAWVQARLSQELGNVDQADSLYREATALLRQYGSPLNTELAMLDHAELRTQLGRGTQDIGELAMQGLKEGRYDTKTAQVAARMVSVLVWGKPTLDSIADLRRKLEQIGGVTCPPRLKST